MKKIAILITVMTVLASSCGEDYLDRAPLTEVSVENFYRNEADVEKAVSAVYSTMQSWPVNIYFYLSEVRSKNYFAVFADAQEDWYDISNFRITSQTGVLRGVWQSCYQLINRANEVLERIDGIEFTDEALKERYKAEVRFLRAFAYFQLVRAFNRVPLVDHVITPEEGIEIGQSEPDEIYAFITSEMSAVMDIFPPAYQEAGDMGRVTKWAAKGILAKVYMTMAGPPLNQAGALSNAKPLLQEIINQEGTYVNLQGNYDEMFTYVNDNKFFIFEIQYLSGGLGVGNQLPSQCYPNLHPDIAEFNALISANRLTLSSDLLDSYDADDLRFNATIDTMYLTSDVPVDTGNTPYFSKFLDPGLALVDRYDWPVNFPVLRYADVLLMYAEVLNEESGPAGEPTAILNRIRDRAGLGSITPATQEAFKLALEEERRKEFAFEGHYWFDLVRTGRAIPVMNEWFSATQQDIQMDEHDLIYPIPLTEMTIFPGLYEQNAGY